MKLTTKPEFNELSTFKQYQLLQETECTVARLERIIESLIVWTGGSTMYQTAKEDYERYLKEKDNG